MAAVGTAQVAQKATPQDAVAAVDAAAKEAVMKLVGPVAKDLGLPAGVQVADRWQQGTTAYALGVFDKAKALADQQAKVAAAEKSAQDLLAQGKTEEDEKPADALRDYARARMATEASAAPVALVQGLGGTVADSTVAQDAENKVSALRRELVLSVVQGDQQRAAEHKPLPAPIVFTAWLKGKRAGGLPMAVTVPGGSTTHVVISPEGKAEAQVADVGAFGRGVEQQIQIGVDWPVLLGVPATPEWVSKGATGAITAKVLKKGISTMRVLVLAQQKNDRDRLTAALKDTGFDVQNGEALINKFGAERIGKMTDAQLRDAARRVADVVLTGGGPIRAVEVSSGTVLYSGPVGSGLVDALKKAAAE